MVAPHSPETLLAFDVGTRRIGIAVGNTLTRTAQPLQIVEAAQPFDRIAQLIDEWHPQRLVVGLPAHADGQATDGTAPARKFANRLRGRFGLPIEFVDERYTSVEARHDARASESGRYEKMRGIDDRAAALILQQYLDAQPPSA